MDPDNFENYDPLFNLFPLNAQKQSNSKSKDQSLESSRKETKI